MNPPAPLTYDVVVREGVQGRLLVLLHGYGQPPEELSDRLDLIDPDARFLVVVPNAPFVRGDQRKWHSPSQQPQAPGEFFASLTAIDHLLGALEQELGLSAADAVVGGFSQGGGMGLGLLLGADIHHRPAAGFGICSFPPLVPGFRVDRAAAADHAFLLSSARADHYAPIEISRACAKTLRDTGLQLTYAEFEGPHELTDGGAAQIGDWLMALNRGDLDDTATDELLAGATSRDPYYEDLWEFVT